LGFLNRLFFMPTLLAVPPHSARKIQLPRVYIFGKTTGRLHGRVDMPEASASRVRVRE
jgi:hypothetical protein